MEQLIREERTLSDLFTELLDETRLLVRQEIALAGVELRKKASAFGVDIGLVVVAAVALFVGFEALVTAAILALALVLPGWASALIISAILAFVGLVLALIGWQDAKNRSLLPEDTIKTLKEDREWIKDQIT